MGTGYSTNFVLSFWSMIVGSGFWKNTKRPWYLIEFEQCDLYYRIIWMRSPLSPVRQVQQVSYKRTQLVARLDIFIMCFLSRCPISQHKHDYSFDSIDSIPRYVWLALLRTAVFFRVHTDRDAICWLRSFIWTFFAHGRHRETDGTLYHERGLMELYVPHLC